MLTVPRNGPAPKESQWALYDFMIRRYRKTSRYRWHSFPIRFMQLVIVLFLLLSVLVVPLWEFGAYGDHGVSEGRILLKLALIWGGGWGVILALYVVNKRFARRDFVLWLAQTWTNGRPPNCLSCNYDLQGSDGPTCPECGEAIPNAGDVRPPNCLSCNYDLRGSEGPTCPECGEAMPSAGHAQKQ